MRPEVTIGLPFYNNAKTVKMAIKSILAQRFQNWELLLIDDGSTDGSAEIARTFDGDRRVTLISDGANRGLAARLNEIAIHTSTPYLARMDADDIMTPDRLEKQVARLKSNLGIDLVSSGAWIIDEFSEPIGKRLPSRSSANLRTVITDIIHPTITGRVEWFRENPYDISYKRTEDFQLWMRALEPSRLEIMEDLLLYYRQESTLDINKYLTGLSESRSITRQLGPARWGRVVTAKMVARNIMREISMRGLATIGQEKWALQRRYAGLSESDEHEACSILLEATSGK